MSSFLIQSAGDGSHDGLIYERPGTSLADEVLIHNYYYFPCWEVPKYHGKDFAKIAPGDYIIHYFNRATKQSPSMIRYVSEVTNVDYTPQQACNNAIRAGRATQQEVNVELSLPRILRLKRIHALNNPIKFQEIRALVNVGVLSKGMKNAGRLGFNLCEVLTSDLVYVLTR